MLSFWINNEWIFIIIYGCLLIYNYQLLAKIIKRYKSILKSPEGDPSPSIKAMEENRHRLILWLSIGSVILTALWLFGKLKGVSSGNQILEFAAGMLILGQTPVTLDNIRISTTLENCENEEDLRKITIGNKKLARILEANSYIFFSALCLILFILTWSLFFIAGALGCFGLGNNLKYNTNPWSVRKREKDA